MRRGPQKAKAEARRVLSYLFSGFQAQLFGVFCHNKIWLLTGCATPLKGSEQPSKGRLKSAGKDPRRSHSDLHAYCPAVPRRRAPAVSAHTATHFHTYFAPNCAPFRPPSQREGGAEARNAAGGERGEVLHLVVESGFSFDNFFSETTVPSMPHRRTDVPGAILMSP